MAQVTVSLQAGKDGPIFELLVVCHLDLVVRFNMIGTLLFQNCTIEQDDNGFVVRRRFHLDNIEGLKKSS